MNKVIDYFKRKVLRRPNLNVDNFSSENQNQIIQWAKRQNKKPIKSSDPLLIIEWNEQGLTSRVNQNGAHSKDVLVTTIRLIPGCNQVPTTGRPSSSIFSFTPTGGKTGYQLMADVITILSRHGNWWKHVNGAPEVGRAFVVYCVAKDGFEIAEHTMVFNVI